MHIYSRYISKKVIDSWYLTGAFAYCKIFKEQVTWGVVTDLRDSGKSVKWLT